MNTGEKAYSKLKWTPEVHQYLMQGRRTSEITQGIKKH